MIVWLIYFLYEITTKDFQKGIPKCLENQEVG